MARLTLVLGGVRSGKSRLAEQLASAMPPVVYLATAQAGDADLAERIARHRRRRAEQPSAWRTLEEPWDLAATLSLQGRPPPGEPPAGCVLVECLSLWVTNLILGLPQRSPLGDDEVRERLEGLVQAIREVRVPVIVVSSEVGWGLLPANALARRFGDLLGEANQRLAREAAEVHVCLAGIPVRIK